MDLALFVVASLAMLWLSAVAILSRRPQARLARGMLASAAVVVGAWVGTASAGITEVGDASLMLSLLRSLG